MKIGFRIWNQNHCHWESSGCFFLNRQGEVVDRKGDFQTHLLPTFSVGAKDKHGVEIYDGDILEKTEEIAKELLEPSRVYPDYVAQLNQHFYLDDDGDFHYIKRRFKIVKSKNDFFEREYIGWFRTCSGAEDGEPVRGLLNAGEFKEMEVVGNIYENIS